jgi:predicted enzyme related to lactoylglutathione lyase
MKPAFSPGRNIAMKIPAHEYASTVDFYRNILGLKEIGEPGANPEETPRFEFGDKVLWLDCVSGISQAEIWLEILTDDIDRASEYFKDQGCARRDEIEPLPEGLKAFWLSSPSNIIHLVKATGAE